MSECPLINAPLQPEEEPILEKLLSIRERLETVRRDRSTYVKSCDVVPLYDELIEQVEQLNQVRKDMSERQNRGIIYLFSVSNLHFHRNEKFQNNNYPEYLTSLNIIVDSVLHACFQLMSLAYLTIGKRHEAPAV